MPLCRPACPGRQTETAQASKVDSWLAAVGGVNGRFGGGVGNVRRCLRYWRLCSYSAAAAVVSAVFWPCCRPVNFSSIFS